MERTRNVLIDIAAASTLLLGLAGCPNEEEAPVSGGTEGDASVCQLCEQSTQLPPAKCVCDGENAANEEFLCWNGQSDCEDHCEAQLDGQGQPLGVSEYTELPCSGSSVVGNCDDWRPEREIDLVAGVYEVDEMFAETLAFDDSSPLTYCDDAKIISVPGGFEVANADAGEFVYELGLRNGDQVLKINGEDVTTWDGAEKVFNSYLDGTSTFSVSVQRGSSTIGLTWTLVP